MSPLCEGLAGRDIKLYSHLTNYGLFLSGMMDCIGRKYTCYRKIFQINCLQHLLGRGSSLDADVDHYVVIIKLLDPIF